MKSEGSQRTSSDTSSRASRNSSSVFTRRMTASVRSAPRTGVMRSRAFAFTHLPAVVQRHLHESAAGRVGNHQCLVAHELHPLLDGAHARVRHALAGMAVRERDATVDQCEGGVTGRQAGVVERRA